MNDANQDRPDVSRRLFLGAAAATAAAVSLDPAEALSPATEGAAAPLRPMVGATYDPSCRSRHSWWKGVSQMPALGLYDCSSPGTLDTHAMLAREYGIDFLMVGHAQDEQQRYRWANTSRLFDRVKTHGAVEIGVALLPDALANSYHAAYLSGRLTESQYVNALSAWFLERHDTLAKDHGWFEDPAYLRDAAGRVVLGFADPGSPDAALAAVGSALSRRPDVAKNTYVWCLGSKRLEAGTRTLRGMLASGGVAWVPSHSLEGSTWDDAHRLYGVLSTRSEFPVASVARATGPGIPYEASDFARQLESIKALPREPRFVLVESFNDWRKGTAIEPVQGQAPVYLEAIRTWRRKPRA